MRYSQLPNDIKGLWGIRITRARKTADKLGRQIMAILGTIQRETDGRLRHLRANNLAAILDGSVRFAIQPILDARTGELMGGGPFFRWYTAHGLIAVPTLKVIPLLKPYGSPHSILVGRDSRIAQNRWGEKLL